MSMRVTGHARITIKVNGRTSIDAAAISIPTTRVMEVASATGELPTRLSVGLYAGVGKHMDRRVP
jgi:hypothetical protein